MSNPDNVSPFRILAWTVFALVVLFSVLFGLNAIGLIGSVAVDRAVIQQSRQYAETNTDAFYTRLESIGRIDTQLADPALTPEMRSALDGQKTLLKNEMRREVAKIPSDAQTPDMAPYR